MASPVSNLARPTVGGGGGGGGDEVYVAATPLRAGKGPAQLLMSAAFSFNIWDLQHFMLILRRSPLSQAFVFDFQPQDPDNIYVALTALSGGTVPGITLIRKIKRLPRRKCWFIGTSKVNAMEAAYKFNTGWHTNLRVGHHDCRDYINGLVEVLTGENEVLEHLRRRARS